MLRPFQPFRRHTTDSPIQDDTRMSSPYESRLFHLTMNFSTAKYVLLLIYCMRTMQQHLAHPTYCTDPKSHVKCQSSACYWLHQIVMNMPRFILTQELLIEQCSFLLVGFFLSCCLFLYSIYIAKHDTYVKTIFRVLLVIPSVIFELLIGFLLFYSIITSLFNYSKTATLYPNYYSSAFIIFAFIVSIVYASLIVIHFGTVYYIINSQGDKQWSAPSVANYSAFQCDRRPLSLNYDALKGSSAIVPIVQENAASCPSGWQNLTQPSATATYSHARSQNGTLNRSCRSMRYERTRYEDDYEYLDRI